MTLQGASQLLSQTSAWWRRRERHALCGPELCVRGRQPDDDADVPGTSTTTSSVDLMLDNVRVARARRRVA